MSNEIKERNILKLILIVRFASAKLDEGHPIDVTLSQFDGKSHSISHEVEMICLAPLSYYSIDQIT
jgi:hypothetical protein